MMMNEQDRLDNISAEQVAEDVQPWQYEDELWQKVTRFQAAGDWVAEARQACPDPAAHNLHTDGRWLYERCPRCGGSENIRIEPPVDLVEGKDGVWGVPRS
jgi:hypothetical protein